MCSSCSVRVTLANYVQTYYRVSTRNIRCTSFYVHHTDAKNQIKHVGCNGFAWPHYYRHIYESACFESRVGCLSSILNKNFRLAQENVDIVPILGHDNILSIIFISSFTLPFNVTRHSGKISDIQSGLNFLLKFLVL
jgi:hypothetical protein